MEIISLHRRRLLQFRKDIVSLLRQRQLLVEIDQKVAEQERVENYAQAVSYYMMDSMIWHNLYLLDLKITAIQKNI